MPVASPRTGRRSGTRTRTARRSEFHHGRAVGYSGAAMGTCPECEENFDLEEGAEVGDMIECPRCKTRLELLSLHPAMVDYATS